MAGLTGTRRNARIALILVVLPFLVMACAVPPFFLQFEASGKNSQLSMTETAPSMTPSAVMEGSWTNETLCPWSLYAPQGTVYVRDCPSSSCSAVGYLLPRVSVYALCLDGQEWCIVESGYVLRTCLVGKCKTK